MIHSSAGDATVTPSRGSHSFGRGPAHLQASQAPMTQCKPDTAVPEFREPGVDARILLGAERDAGDLASMPPSGRTKLER